MHYLKYGFGWFVTYIIVQKGISPLVYNLFIKYFFEPTLGLFKRRFLKTEKDWTIWLHHLNAQIDKKHDL